MSEEHTTAVIQRYLDELDGDSPAEPIVRALLDRAVRRLRLLCATLLHRSYPRLTQPPLNLQADELLGAVAERLLKALRDARPRTVRQLFAMANQHMRWELNDLARRLDQQPAAVDLRDELVPSPATSGSGLTADGLQKTKRTKAVEGARKSVLAHRIVDHRNTFAASDFTDAADKIFPRIDDDMIAAVSAGDRSLLILRHQECSPAYEATSSCPFF
jgi:hypothetical protein